MTAQPESVALRVVTVCTMNLCRSPAMATVLDRNFAAMPQLMIHVFSAGTEAEPGKVRCGLSQALIGVDEPTGHARALSVDLIADADLILTADSGHLRQVVALNPATRARTFTLAEAARLATWVVDPDGPLGPAPTSAQSATLTTAPNRTQALTERQRSDAAAKARRLIVEMDAARGVAPIGHNRFGYLRVDVIGPDDIPDPHVLGYGLHQEAVAAIVATAESWTNALKTTMSR